MSEVATEMRALAEALAAGDEGLDFGLDSLKELEQRILARRRSSIAGDEQQAWGAYLGETIARSAEGVQWVGFASAAAEAPAVAQLGEDAETAAILRAGDRFWFPHVKVAKLIANGAEDSIAALAALVVAQQRPPEPPKTWDLSESLALARAFMAEPTAERLRALDRGLSLPRRELPRFYRESGLAVAPLTALFAAPASGRGYARVDPGRCAARHAAALLVSGAVPREPAMSELRALLSDKAKVVRTRAAFVVASCLLADGRLDELSTLARDGKAGVDLGALDAIRSDAGARRMNGEKGTVDVEPLAPVLVLGLEAKDERRESALDALFTIASWLKCDITSVLPALVASLASERPAVRERAMEVLKAHAFNVLHGRARYDERLAGVVRRIAELSRPRLGAQKVTKEQIAARYALGALERIREHFDADTAKLVEEALAAVSHVR